MGYHGVTKPVTTRGCKPCVERRSWVPVEFPTWTHAIQNNSEEELSFSVKEGPTWNFRDFFTLPKVLGKKLSRFLSFTLRVFPTDPLRGDFLGGIAMGLDAIRDIHAGGQETLRP